MLSIRSSVWRVVAKIAYLRGMGKYGHRSRVEPVRQLPGLLRWAGMWVAVKDGEVIAAAHNSRELVPMVKSKGEGARGAVAQYVPQPSDEIVIGVG
jgi:hypothetical protein